MRHEPQAPVLTELFAVTHSLETVARLPRPAGFSPGDTVAVLGVGPVGIVHAAKAALMGAGRVIAVDRHSFRLDLAAELGATDCILAGDDGAETAARIRELSGGGADVVVDASGFPETFLPSIDALRDGGTLIEVGAFVDLGPVAFNPAVLCGRNLTLLGIGGEDARAYPGTLALLARHHERVPFAHLVTHRFPLTEAAEAMRVALEARAAMKVVVEPVPSRIRNS